MIGSSRGADGRGRVRGPIAALVSVLGVVCGIVLLAMGLAPPAAGAVTCTFDPAATTVTVTMQANDAGTIVRSGVDILVNGAKCTGTASPSPSPTATPTATPTASPPPAVVTATVDNTSTIAFTGTFTGNESVTIDLSGGPFAPSTSTSGSVEEIDFTNLDLADGEDTLEIVGSADADSIHLGTTGINLNDDGVADVTPPSGGAFNVETTIVAAGDGDDVVEGDGGDVIGEPYGSPLTVSGGSGNDRLTGGAKKDTLRGEEGDDTLAGGAKADVIDGGKGIDAVSYRHGGGAVVVNLAEGVVGGAGGKDSLVGIENATGSNGGDILVGSPKPNDLVGLGGADQVSGMGGNDRLTGNGGNDRLTGGKGLQDECSGGPGADAFSTCETIIPGPQPA